MNSRTFKPNCHPCKIPCKIEYVIETSSMTDLMKRNVARWDYYNHYMQKNAHLCPCKNCLVRIKCEDSLKTNFRLIKDCSKHANFVNKNWALAEEHIDAEEW